MEQAFRHGCWSKKHGNAGPTWLIFDEYRNVLRLACRWFRFSFLVLDISRAAAYRSWPTADGMVAGRFRLFPVFLALFAGPSLFAGAIWRMHLSGSLSSVDVILADVIASGWAGCYGLLLVEGAWFLFPGSPLSFGQ